MKAALLLVVLAAVGCGGPVDHVEYWADGTIPAEDAAAACEGWAKGVGVECTRVDSSRANVLITSFHDGHHSGATDTWKTPVTVKVDATGFWPVPLANSIAHELGHAMGLGHLDGGPAVMNTQTGYDLTALTDIDIAGWHAMGR